VTLNHELHIVPTKRLPKEVAYSVRCETHPVQELLLPQVFWVPVVELIRGKRIGRNCSKSSSKEKSQAQSIILAATDLFPDFPRGFPMHLAFQTRCGIVARVYESAFWLCNAGKPQSFRSRMSQLKSSHRSYAVLLSQRLSCSSVPIPAYSQFIGHWILSSSNARVPRGLDRRRPPRRMRGVVVCLGSKNLFCRKFCITSQQFGKPAESSPEFLRLYHDP
jgi:hypothetical protein